MVGVLRRRFHRLDPFGEHLFDGRPIDRTRFENQRRRRRFRLQFFKKSLFVDSSEPSRRRAELLPGAVAIRPVFLNFSASFASLEGPSVSRGAIPAFESLVFAGFALVSVALEPPFSRRGVAPFETSTSKTISPVGVRVERAAPFAAVRLRVAPFGVSSVVSFRAFLGQSHPFVFRSKLQNQSVRSDVKIRRSVKVDAQPAPRRSEQTPERRTSERARQSALAVSARRIKRNIRRRF